MFATHSEETSVGFTFAVTEKLTCEAAEGPLVAAKPVFAKAIVAVLVAPAFPPPFAAKAVAVRARAKTTTVPIREMRLDMRLSVLPSFRFGCCCTAAFRHRAHIRRLRSLVRVTDLPQLRASTGCIAVGWSSAKVTETQVWLEYSRTAAERETLGFC